MVILKEFFEKGDFEKKSADDKINMKNFPGGKELIIDDHHSTLLSTVSSPSCRSQSEEAWQCLFVGPWQNDQKGIRRCKMSQKAKLVTVLYLNVLMCWYIMYH